jgi:hypothetical protein
VVLVFMRPKPSPRVSGWIAKQSATDYSPPQLPRQKSSLELSCSLIRASVARDCCVRRRICLRKIWEVVFLVSKAMPRDFFPQSPLTAVRSVNILIVV